MKILKKGKKKFLIYRNVKIYHLMCEKCECEFEIQSGELPRDEGGGYHYMQCPYCKRFHYNWQFLGEEIREIDENKVIGIPWDSTEIIKEIKS